MTTIGRYTITRELGRGGMATVYLAHDPSFGRDVALKVLPRAFLHDQTFLSRFQREARTIATLEHQSIVPVYDFGEQDGQPFLVMRHMTGGTLASYIVNGPLSLAETARIMNQLALALDYAHSRGVIHRDLKPGNVLFDDQDNAFLSDFGIAKLAEATANLTGSAVIGTPAYMSPEQVHGQRDIDGRSDIYTLGIILYQMLAGRLPYQADTPARQMMAHVLEPVPQVHQARPDLPEACGAIVQKAMAKTPDKRFDTAVALVTALQNATPTRPAAPPTAIDAGKETVVAPPPQTEVPGAEAAAESSVDAPAAPPAQPPIAPPEPLAETEVLAMNDAATAGAIADRLEAPATPPETEYVPRPALAGRRRTGWLWALLALAAVAVVVGLALFSGDDGVDTAVAPAAGDDDDTAVVVSEFIKTKWAEGFDVTSLAYGNSIWAAIMSQPEGVATQVWHTSAEFPKDDIEARWAEGYDVTQLAYGGGVWVVMLTQDGIDLQQTWQTSATFPIEWIEQRWAQGYDVTQLAYGNGVWAVIMSQGGVVVRQAWQTAAEFPADWIQTKWDEGLDIAALAYGNGVWAVIMATDVGGTRQNWRAAATFPADWIETEWSEGFDVTHLAYGNGRWLVVMAQGQAGSRQTWQTGRYFTAVR